MKRYSLIYLGVLISCISGKLFVDRNSSPSSCSKHFCESLDIFANIKKSLKFCKSRNAVCTTKNCTTCSCDSNDVFVSYKHGCKDTFEVNQMFNDSFSFYARSYAMDIPLINSNSLSYQQCQRLSSKDDNINVIDCKISGVYSIDAIDGLKQSVKDHPFLVQQAMAGKRILFQCIQCKEYVCDFKDLRGMLIKIDLQCVNADSNTEVQGYFMVKVMGTLHSNESFPASTMSTISFSPHRPNEQKDNESNSPTILIIVIVAVCLCLMILSILAVLLFRYRKKLRIRKKSQCAHYVVDETGQDNSYNAVNPAYEDVETKVSSHGEYATISNQVLKTTTEEKKSAENVYYKSTFMDSNNSTLDNSLSQNIYAELDEGSK